MQSRLSIQAKRSAEIVNRRPGVSTIQLAQAIGVEYRQARRFTAILRSAGYVCVGDRIFPPPGVSTVREGNELLDASKSD